MAAGADVSVLMDLEAKALYNELTAIQTKFASFASKVTTEGDKAGKGFSSTFASSIGSGIGKVGSFFSGALAGIFSVSFFERGISETIRYASQIQDLSERFGVGADAIQRLGNAAALQGVSLESVTTALNKIEVSRSKALAGNNEMISAFAKLGITFEQLKTLAPDQLMLAIGARSRDLADFTKVAGRNAGELVSTLEKLSKGDLKFGPVVSPEDIARLDAFGDAMTIVAQRIRSVATTLLGELIPAIGKAQDFFAKPFELVTRGFDKTPLGEAAAPEDTALARQIHAAREREAGRELPKELGPEAKIEPEKKPIPGAEGVSGKTKDEEDEIIKARERLNEETRKATEAQLEPAQRYAALQADIAKVDAELAKQGKDDSLEKIKLEERRLGLTREMSATEKEWQRDSEAAEREKERAAKEAAKAAAVKSRTGAAAPEPSPYSGLTLREALHQLQIEESSKPLPKTTYKTPEEFAADSARAEAQLSKISGLGEATTDRSKLDLEGIRAGELEAGMQHALADQELQIAKWEAGQRLLEQIRDNIGANK